MELGKKARILCVLKYLENYSDCEHALTSADILQKLSDEGITAERKAVYDDIEILRELGYDVVTSGGKNRGYYLANRSFSMPEVNLLTDAVMSAGFIPKGKTKNLVEKLHSLVSVYEADEIRSRICIENRAKSENDGVFGIIEQLNDAIINRKTVKIVYTRDALGDKGVEKSKKEITVCPYALLWDADRYYVIGNNPKYDNLMHLRVDRIESVTSLKQPWRHFCEVSEYKQRFDTADYASKTFNMFGGEKCRIDLECKLKLLDQITDKFTDNLFFRHFDGEDTFRFSADALISDGLVGWLMQFGGDIKVLSPETLKQSVREKAETLANIYKD